MININKLFKNILFLLKLLCIFTSEFICYKFSNNHEKMILNITRKLSYENILFIKIFQAFVLNNNLINEEINNKLLKYTDNVPWNENDIDYDTLKKIENEFNLSINSKCNPINSGMISLVFLAKINTNQKVVIKIKRKNIENKLNDGIEYLLFFIKIISYISYVKNLNIDKLIFENIEIFKIQTDFVNEVQNAIKIQQNCKNIKFIVIPHTYEYITHKYNNVIVMDYIIGLPIYKLPKEDYETYAKLILKFGFITTFIHGYTHGDLHSGNILFIKDTDNSNYIYKIGILDFGIMHQIENTFRENIMNICLDFFSNNTEQIAKNILYSGLIQPLNTIKNLPKIHYINLINILSSILDETIKNKNINNIKIYKFLNLFNDYIINNELLKYNLRPSDEFLKAQMSLMMANGLTITLCNNDYMEVAEKVLNELFHIDFLLKT